MQILRGSLFGVLAALALLILALTPATVADAPIVFTKSTLAGAGVTFNHPTSVAFGPDGRLYVAELEGRIRALTIGPGPDQIAAVEQVTALTDLQEVLGIAFDPTDTSSPPPVYASNTVTGQGFEGFAPEGSYPGKITKIDGVGYATRTDIITGLPNSNSLHQTNGIAFAADGTLYIAQGSTTNAGVPGGPFPYSEVPLSGAILVASPSAPSFDGVITHDPPETYGTSVDQVSGDVSVYAAGFRNPYDLVLHSNGRIYATDNGPNFEAGPASTGCATESSDPSVSDELNLVEPGDYYGHPNRNRGRTDPRQCIYHPGTEGSGLDWTGPIEMLPSSSNGLVEYTSSALGGKLIGDLLYVQMGNGVVGRIQLSADGTSVVGHTEIASGLTNPLDITMGPDGTLYIAEFGFAPGSGNVIALTPALSPPASPTNLQAIVVHDQLLIQLLWEDNADNESTYIVERSTGGADGPWIPLAVLPANTTMYGDGGLIDGATYWYRVAAENSSGASGYSNVAFGTATELPTPPVGDADCNGSVTSVDAALVLQFNAGLFAFLLCEEFADANADGELTSIDALLILQFVAGLLDTLPP